MTFGFYSIGRRPFFEDRERENIYTCYMNANSHTLFFHLIPNTTKSPCTHTHTYSDETKQIYNEAALLPPLRRVVMPTSLHVYPTVSDHGMTRSVGSRHYLPRPWLVVGLWVENTFLFLEYRRCPRRLYHRRHPAAALAPRPRRQSIRPRYQPQFVQ